MECVKGVGSNGVIYAVGGHVLTQRSAPIILCIAYNSNNASKKLSIFVFNFLFRKA